MQLRRIPPRILIALGLSTGCGPQDNQSGDTFEVTGPCLDVATTACLGMTPTTGDPSGDPVGPCLDIATDSCLSRCLDSTGGSFIDPSDSSFGPCLDIAPTDSSDSGSGSESGSDSGSDSGSTTALGPCLSPPGDDSPAPPGAPGELAGGSTGRSVLDRVLSSGRLPPDIMARLRNR